MDENFWLFLIRLSHEVFLIIKIKTLRYDSLLHIDILYWNYFELTSAISTKNFPTYYLKFADVKVSQ